MLTFQSAVTYLLALAIPVIYLTYRHYARPQTTQIPAEDSKKPLKSIMQGPRDDLEPPKDNPYTTEALKEFDGSNTSKPIYVAIKGTIFDVTHKAEVYGRGRSYNIFAGKDGSRGLGKSSLKPEDAVADYSDLDEKDLKVLDDWYSFFQKRYNIVGKVVGDEKGDAADPPPANL
ncbi:hypothetical protein K443DRAFT_675311 [Laccaria amethystina LaAM-08-1]|uniref:Cytochrome b5 heme-binding domain-containing protein n=1 Tax=Laccaria amethystina LaAM-08-1 TaxID=1095629 RepID=A0A0C9YAS5_9AGAR|nr:hypothetical protein K443DRAFT_675311 [Laccaria amethystina LaAM-08-1]